jgi:hypothetical protein
MSSNRVTVGGLSGEVRWSYHTAASVGKWTVTADASGHTLTAVVVSHDAFKVSQRPLTFVVDRGRGQWIWSINTLQIAGDTLTATLAPQE